MQEMVDEGVEMLVGVAHDPVFGPVVACGAGGTTVELVHDVAVRVTPITDLDASEMVRSLRTFPLLEGFRGAPKADVLALEEVILRVGALVDNHPSIAEMDCNPVMVLPRGAVSSTPASACRRPHRPNRSPPARRRTSGGVAPVLATEVPTGPPGDRSP